MRSILAGWAFVTVLPPVVAACGAPCPAYPPATKAPSLSGVYEVTYTFSKARSLFEDSPANNDACAATARTSLALGVMDAPRTLYFTDNGNGTLSRGLSRDADGRIFAQRASQRVVFIDQYKDDAYQESARHEVDIDSDGNITGTVIDGRLPQDVKRMCEITFSVRGRRR
jgi:hypothetical protein